MNNNSIAEIYLSFATVFHRPKQDISDHLEDLIDIWAEEIPGIECSVQELRTFCSQFPPGEERLNTLWEHYIPLFETGAVEASPYASVYFEEDGLVLGKEAFSVKQFYVTCGYVMGESKELPDHLAVELEFCALLARSGQYKELNKFEQRHLNPFLKRVLPRIINSNRPFYAGVAAILETRQLNLEKEGDFVG
ncbi:TorD/DmsD family molecular chaperone [Desulfitobacterium sp.]|uniref:TorD/DmsD family molecular chaperone n=1 Tax=Desulfitobacterium sp. TaxID=49981 RepID=UPI002B20B905|nr:molecular chaperone TorD family protein [Desulfitobacterium sp.]MEA4902767.1 molecular chaperone TorD family protein [Desulfitobacterium sp.]